MNSKNHSFIIFSHSFQNETTYTACVTLFNTMDPYTTKGGAEEVPRFRLEVPIMCTYMKNMLISADFGSIGYV